MPHVDDDGGFDGWVVHTPPGWVADADDPTQSELDLVLARCVRACEQEYEGSASAHVSATCNASGAFETPTSISIDASPARQSIPDAYRDGSGIWFSETVACNLLGSCSSEFAEDLHPAVPRRVTPAESQLGRGQQWGVNVVGEIKTMVVRRDHADAAQLALDDDGNGYVVLDGRRMFALRDGEAKEIELPTRVKTTAIGRDPSGDAWIVVDDAIHVRRGEGWQAESLPEDSAIDGIAGIAVGAPMLHAATRAGGRGRAIRSGTASSCRPRAPKARSRA